jgi:hypothetical protein
VGWGVVGLVRVGMGWGRWRKSTSIMSHSAHNTALNSSGYLAHISQLL